ncbi:unnamed protein product [Heligmosomoides polygyrus]|uniref:Uncharacterized protein n=1 Tax=Heligmosomoides polygyrus TaxID=6339 RepID=A0A183GBQ5_HELPZ|nr:unnamed protein product [Heligmosomoides polygyrus]
MLLNSDTGHDLRDKGCLHRCPDMHKPRPNPMGPHAHEHPYVSCMQLAPYLSSLIRGTTIFRLRQHDFVEILHLRHTAQEASCDSYPRNGGNDVYKTKKAGSKKLRLKKLTLSAKESCSCQWEEIPTPSVNEHRDTPVEGPPSQEKLIQVDVLTCWHFFIP